MSMCALCRQPLTPRSVLDGSGIAHKACSDRELADIAHQDAYWSDYEREVPMAVFPSDMQLADMAEMDECAF